MKLKYLKELLGYRQSYCCNDYSCSMPIDTTESTPDKRISVSSTIPFDIIEINKGSIVVIKEVTENSTISNPDDKNMNY